MNEFDDEIWKPVIYKGIDYTGRFEISNFGRIRTLKYNPPRIQKAVVNKNGYCECSFPRPDGRYNYTTVHRIVMMMFNPVEGMEHLEVNHKDECKTNNKLENLEWCTSKENCNYGSRPNKIGKISSKPVMCIETREIFRNQEEACLYANTTPDVMSVHLQGKQNHIHGKHYARIGKYFDKEHCLSETDINYIIEEENKLIKSRPLKKSGKILCVETGQIYDSQMEASRQTGILQPVISEALRGLIKTAGGYTWKRIESI